MKRIALALSVILASAALGGDGPGFLGDVTNTTTVTLGNSIGSYTYKDIAVTQPCSCVLVRVSGRPLCAWPCSEHEKAVEAALGRPHYRLDR